MSTVNNQKKYKIFRILLYVIVGLTLVNALFLGYSNYTEMKKKNKLQQLQVYSQMAEDGDVTAKGKVEKLEKELAEESPFSEKLKMINLMLLSLLTVILGTLILSMFMANLSVVTKKRQLAQMNKKLSKELINFETFSEKRRKLISLFHSILKLLEDKEEVRILKEDPDFFKEDKQGTTTKKS